MTQKKLESIVLGVVAIFALMILVTRPILGDVVLSVGLFVAILVPPFWVDSLIRFKFIPWLDSLNETKEESSRPRYERQTEDFSLWIRVTIWAFLGVLLAWIWSYFVPGVFALPLWIGRLAGVIGWKSLLSSDGVWQYGWMIVFLVQYLIDFLVGLMMSSDFKERFKYPEE